jgi:Amt family ammonium transporter
METITFTVDNLWLMIATILVFVMHLGFASLEAGLTRAKNTVNIMFKNTMIISIGLLSYAFIGFNLMYPGEAFQGAVFGFAGFGLELPANGLTEGYSGSYTYWTDFLFQAMFAATAATIVSGAVAERIKMLPFLFFALVYVAVCYPIVGMWKWGGGFLDTMSTPFYDFAGSSIVHSFGGWGALIAAILLGPRAGKYINGKIKPIPGHSIPFAVIGVFLLWFGWFGFNGGSVLSADAGTVSLVFVTTSISAAAGAIGAFLASYIAFRKPDLTMVLNGILGGLVGITAGADQMGLTDSTIIGFIAGLMVVFAVVFFDRVKVDDPVGAISVHLVCGVWGTMAVGIFGELAGLDQFVSQAKGVVAIGAFSLACSFILLFILKKTVGIRVDKNEEQRGLDISEHGMNAYPDYMLK